MVTMANNNILCILKNVKRSLPKVVTDTLPTCFNLSMMYTQAEVYDTISYKFVQLFINFVKNFVHFVKGQKIWVTIEH